jgi:hypothetical protein
MSLVCSEPIRANLFETGKLIMDKLYLVFKGLFGTIGALWSLAVGALGWALPALVVMMAIDFITGVFVGSVR